MARSILFWDVLWDKIRFALITAGSRFFTFLYDVMNKIEGMLGCPEREILA